MIRDIFNTYRHAFRVYLRQRSRPKSLEEAEEKRLLWSKFYAYATFGSLVIATYITSKEKINFAYDEKKQKDKAVLEKLIDSPTKVVKFMNFQKVTEYDFEPVTNTTVPNK